MNDINEKSKFRRLEDAESEKKPSLRISHIVYGREKRGTRVVFLVDEKGNGTKKMISEEVVLYRWRRRKFPGYVFSGARLGPNLWTTLPKLLGSEVSHWLVLTEEELQSAIANKKNLTGDVFAKIPAANVLHALLAVCGLERLNLLVERHRDHNGKDSHGVPDLFLFAKKVTDGTCTIARFVEVKKPEEPTKGNQHEEIAFLQSMGLHARVLRLDERD